MNKKLLPINPLGWRGAEGDVNFADCQFGRLIITLHCITKSAQKSPGLFPPLTHARYRARELMHAFCSVNACLDKEAEQ